MVSNAALFNLDGIQVGDLVILDLGPNGRYVEQVSLVDVEYGYIQVGPVSYLAHGGKADGSTNSRIFPATELSLPGAYAEMAARSKRLLAEAA